MNGADSRAGQHGVNGFGDHRHIDRNAVPLGDTAFLESVRQPAHFPFEFAIGDFFLKGWLIALPDQGHVVFFFRQVPVDAVVTGIQHAVFVPFNGNGFIEGGVFNFFRRGKPVKAAAHLFPKSFGVLKRSGVKLFIFFRRDVSASDERFRGRKYLFFFGHFEPRSFSLGRL